MAKKTTKEPAKTKESAVLDFFKHAKAAGFVTYESLLELSNQYSLSEKESGALSAQFEKENIDLVSQ